MPNWDETPDFLLKSNNPLIGIDLLTNCSFSYPELAKVLIERLGQEYPLVRQSSNLFEFPEILEVSRDG